MYYMFKERNVLGTTKLGEEAQKQTAGTDSNYQVRH